MKKCRRNRDIGEQGRVWWNDKEIFDAEMARRSLLVDKPRKESQNGSNREGNKEVSG